MLQLQRSVRRSTPTAAASRVRRSYVIPPVATRRWSVKYIRTGLGRTAARESIGSAKRRTFAMRRWSAVAPGEGSVWRRAAADHRFCYPLGAPTAVRLHSLACDQTVYGPPLNTHCATLEDRRGGGAAGSRRHAGRYDRDGHPTTPRPRRASTTRSSTRTLMRWPSISTRRSQIVSKACPKHLPTVAASAGKLLSNCVDASVCSVSEGGLEPPRPLIGH